MVEMIAAGPELPPYSLESDKHAIRITGLSQNDLLSLLSPGGITGPDEAGQGKYAVPGIKKIDISPMVQEGTIVIRFNSLGFASVVASSRKDNLMVRLDEWLSWHFSDLREAQRITSDALKASRMRRSDTSS